MLLTNRPEMVEMKVAKMPGHAQHRRHEHVHAHAYAHDALSHADIPECAHANEDDAMFYAIS